MILVTGGTGFVGQEVVGKLLELGHHVRLLVRNPKRAALFARNPGVEVAVGDVLKPESLGHALQGIQTVIHIVGIITETSKVTYEQAHMEATRNVLSAARGAGVTRWIQMSAIGTRLHARSRYHQTKWQAEELVRQSGLDWTIFRPSLIYGHDEKDRFLNLMRLVLRSPLAPLTLFSLPLIDGGAPFIQPVSVREVAHCFASAVTRQTAIGQTYDLVGPEPFRWREMILKILAALGKQGVYEQIPLLVLVRALIWLVVLSLPILAGVALSRGGLTWTQAIVGTFVWSVFVLIARSWQRTIIFYVPGELLVLASEPLNTFAPRELRASEVLKMAREDNTGDPLPAAQAFAYIPETFDQGLANCYARR